MKKLYIALSLILLLAAWTYGVYRYIMCNLQPYCADGYVFIDFMGHTDMYDGDLIFEED